MDKGDQKAGKQYFFLRPRKLILINVVPLAFSQYVLSTYTFPGKVIHTAVKITTKGPIGVKKIL